MEITFSGIEAVKIYHFCKTELENLGKYLHARVSKEPPEGSPTKVTITGDKKYATDIRTNVDKMKDQLKNLTEGEYFSYISHDQVLFLPLGSSI